MSAEWKCRREGGGRFALRLMRTMARHGGRRFGRLCLYPISLYFTWRRADERADSRAYLARVLGRRPEWREVVRHVHTFAATVLDRVFLLGEHMQRFDVRVHGLDDLHRQMDLGRGVLLFGSHLGSFEVLRVLSLQRPDAKLRVVLDRAHGAALTEMLDALNPEIARTVIDAGQDGPGIMFAIQEAMAEGALVAMLVDRVQPGGEVVRVPFLGAPAAFPVAPWLVAAVLQAPVALAFGLYRGGNRYDLLFEPFTDGFAVPRRERATAVPALIARYAARLEHHVRDAPYNWFNFYDFWASGDSAGGEHDRRTPMPAAEPRPAGPGIDGDGAGAGAGDTDAARRAAAG